MVYIAIGVLVVLFIILILVYPFKINIYNEDEYLFINISNFVNLKLNLLVLIENIDKINLEKQKKSAKFLKNVRFEEVDLKIEGVNFDYQINGLYFGIMHALLGVIDCICYAKGIELKYDLKYLGEKSVKFNSVIRARISNVIIAFVRI